VRTGVIKPTTTPAIVAHYTADLLSERKAARKKAVDAALGSGMRAGATLSAALADSDPSVRKAALERGWELLDADSA